MDEIDRKILRDSAAGRRHRQPGRWRRASACRPRRVCGGCGRSKRRESSAASSRCVDGKAVGAGFVAYVEVRLEKQSEAFSSRFETAILARPEVLECAFVTGGYDYLLKIAVADLDEFHRFLTETLARIDGVANTRTTIPVKRIKETTALRVGAGGDSARRDVAFDG